MSMMFFHFLKIIFDISILKRSKKYKPHLILTKKKSKFDETQLETQCQTVSESPGKKCCAQLGLAVFGIKVQSVFLLLRKINKYYFNIFLNKKYLKKRPQTL